MTICTEESDKSRVTSLSCVNKIITHSLEKLNQQIKTVYIESNGCASQFRSRYVLAFLRIYNQIFSSSSIKTRPTTVKTRWMGSVLL